MMQSERTVIKFSHEEVEALLRLFDDIVHDEREPELNEVERSARDKLKKIYARQILSHEKRLRDFATERRNANVRAEDNNS